MVRLEDLTLWDEAIGAVPTEIKNEVPDAGNPELEDFTLLDETFSLFPEPAVDPREVSGDIAEFGDNIVPDWLFPLILVLIAVLALGTLFNINIGGD